MLILLNALYFLKVELPWNILPICAVGPSPECIFWHFDWNISPLRQCQCILNEILGNFDRLAYQDCAKQHRNELYDRFYCATKPVLWTNLSTTNYHSLTHEATPNLWGPTLHIQIRTLLHTTCHRTDTHSSHHYSVVLTFDWAQHKLLLLVMHTSKLFLC